MKQIAVVTGASSGMGREFVRQIAQKYHVLDEIWVIARREQPVRQLQKELIHIRIRSFFLDLKEEDSFGKLRNVFKKEKPRVMILANASGIGISGKFDSLEEDEICEMISVNCAALTRMTHLVLPYLGKGSCVYQFASSAAFAPQPGFSVYAASKSYVLSLTTALRQELKTRGIKVIAVCPGPVNTAFFDRAYQHEEMKFYKKLVMADPKKVVKKALKDGRRNRGISVYGGMMKVLRVICKLLPADWIVKVMG